MAERKYEFDNPKAAFAEAEKRIQQALKSGETDLDLGYLGLTESLCRAEFVLPQEAGGI